MFTEFVVKKSLIQHMLLIQIITGACLHDQNEPYEAAKRTERENS